MGRLSKEWGMAIMVSLTEAYGAHSCHTLSGGGQSPFYAIFLGACLTCNSFLRVTTIAVMKHYDQKGRKGFIVLMLSYHMSSSKEIRTGTQAWQEPGGRN